MEETVNIELILEEIRASIKDEECDLIDFEEIPIKDLSSNLSDGIDAYRYINSNYELHPYRILAGNPLKVFIKKVIRKLAKFYIEPLAHEQSTFNAQCVRILNSLRKEELQELSIKNLEHQIILLEKKIDQLEEKLNNR